MTAESSAHRWLTTEAADPAMVVVGVPNSRSSRPGSRADLAPLLARDRLETFSTFHAALGVDISSVGVRDMGNWPVTTIDPVPLIGDLGRRARDLPDGVKVYLGGDNAITRPLVVGESDDVTTMGLICFDAKHGADDLSGGPTAHNATRGLVEDGVPGQNIVQIGIHPLANPASARQFCDDNGVTTVTVDDIERIGMNASVDVALNQLKSTCSSIYVDIDLGVLDSSVAPAAESSLPGGLTIRELARGVARCAAHQSVGALDLVGVDPSGDADDRTIDLMAYLLVTAAAGLATR